MRCITREVKMYKYIFANIDHGNGQARNIQQIETPEPMGHRAIKAYCEEHDNAVLIHKETYTKKYSLPLSRFVKACISYADDVLSGEYADTDSVEVEEEEDESDETEEDSEE